MEKYSIEPYKEEQSPLKDFREEEAYLRAKKRVEAISGFYWHLASYVIVNVFLILLIGFNAGFSGFGPYATAFFWGIGLLFHFIGVFGFNFLLGKNWEQRKIEEFMQKEREKDSKFNGYE
ncbi:2TM domain-containing protein [Winogradskyella wandonensis]|uniref:2TM domain-containing protein n=2 Tax=Winogradskyella TaxID=286104 RepID=A0A4V2PU58_9FLAO|nr:MULTISPECIES: 2TM domain-containing protein [Winogradskyella]TCK68861.1 2TM domain-containing protein [Winogradskyella wandonensis]SHH40273.1 2TM domain-containing protein [Winogradskyella jejuensis]